MSNNSRYVFLTNFSAYKKIYENHFKLSYFVTAPLQIHVIFIFSSSNAVTIYCTGFIIWINNSKILITCLRIRKGDYPLVNVHVVVLKLLLLQ